MPAVKEGGRPAEYSGREIVNAILYVNRTGCAWRLLPHDLPAYCFLPLYVFCGEQLLVSYLRPSNTGAGHHCPAILKLLVKGLRAAWPQVKILLRGDSGFCRWRLLSWCERHGVEARGVEPLS